MAKEKSQAEKFKDLAREIGADENEESFRDKLRRIAKQKPDKPAKGEKQKGE